MPTERPWSSSVLPTDMVWASVVESLDKDPAEELNTAWECCERYATDRSRLAITFRNPDGTSQRWTYFDLAHHSARVSDIFVKAGLKTGDRIAAVLSRQIESWICAIAAWRSGLVYVPLFCGFGADALAYRLETSHAKMVVVDHEWRSSVHDAQEILSSDLHVVTVAGPKGIGLRAGDHSFWAEMAEAQPIAAPVTTLMHDPATLLFTSGTTGQPKACVIPHSGFISLIPYVDHALGLRKGDLLFTTSDPGWAYGLYTTGIVPLARGIPLVSYSGPFDPVAWLKVLEAEQATYITAAPTAFRKLVGAIRHHGAASSLRAAAGAGEPLDADTVTVWQKLTGTPIRDGYGLTEVGMALANLADPATALVPGAMGSEVPGFEVELVEADGVVLQGEAEGLIAIRQPQFQLATDYENVPEEWEARWTGDLFVTEDRARRDDKGNWWFVGRDDDIIVTAGYNVGPTEVESILVEHPAVSEAAVVASPDEERGSVVRAVIVTQPEVTPSGGLTKELQDAVKSRLGRHAYPRLVEYVESLPRTEVGKVRRAALRTAETVKHPNTPGE